MAFVAAISRVLAQQTTHLGSDAAGAGEPRRLVDPRPDRQTRSLGRAVPRRHRGTWSSSSSSISQPAPNAVADRGLADLGTESAAFVGQGQHIDGRSGPAAACRLRTYFARSVSSKMWNGACRRPCDSRPYRRGSWRRRPRTGRRPPSGGVARACATAVGAASTPSTSYPSLVSRMECSPVPHPTSSTLPRKGPDLRGRRRPAAAHRSPTEGSGTCRRRRIGRGWCRIHGTQCSTSTVT